MVLIVSFILLRLAAIGLALQIESGSLQCNGLTTPLGLSSTKPRLSWIPQSSARNDTQTAYQVQVSSDETFEQIDLWDTRRVISEDFSTTYNGMSLASRQKAYWRVKVWDVHSTPSTWSETSWFEVALMQQDDWQAKWITNEQYVNGSNALPIFAKAFEVLCAPSSARLYYIGLGVHWAALNGKAVTDEVLLPSYSTMNKTLFYSSYDVTSLLQSGSNVLVVELGKGVYTAEKGLDGRYTKFVASGAPLPLKLLAQLEYSCGDGQLRKILSDETWKTTVDGPMLESSWYGGEEYDARRAQLDAYVSIGDRSNWTQANLTDSPYPDLKPKLLSPNMPPLRIVETFPCISVARTSSSWVFDFEQNIAGWYRFGFSGTRGQRITIWPGEVLLANGSVSQSTTGYPIFDGYTFAGNGVESHSPKFMYHGFRYLEIFGLSSEPSAGDIIAQRIRSDVSRTGSFESSFGLFNDIHRIVDQAIQNQVYSVLTDCPHREKMGWLDQDQLAIDSVLFGYNLRGYGRQMIKQMADSQNSAGEIPTTAPQLTVFGSWPPYGDGYDNEPNWGVAMILFALEHYKTYGDIEILEENYSHMVAYIDYLTAQNATSHILSYGLGDWEAIDASTPFGVTATSGYVRGVRAMETITTKLGRAADASTYAALHGQILTAFQETFFNTTNNVTTYGSGSQACDAIALDIGAVPSQYSQPVYEHLMNSIINNGTHLTVGEVGLPAVVRVLTAGGYHDFLYSIMSSTTYPSYGFLVEQGATTMTEYWSGPQGTGSQDHIILDYGDTWLSGLAGARQADGSIAWKQIEFDPVIVGDIMYADMSYHSVRGLVAARWELHDGLLSYNVTIPVGSVGTVYIPCPLGSATLDGIFVGKHAFVRKIWQSARNKTAVSVGSGSYLFTAKTDTA